jgi:membrane-anchored mycosin MYCP
MTRAPGRITAFTMVVLLTGMLSNAPAAMAVDPPSIDPALVPSDNVPGPEQPMRQSNICARTVTLAEPNVGLPAPGFSMLDISRAWQYSTGNGVSVAVIDTGVTPSARLPAVPGGDYIMGGDGLSDCDAHGTVVASLIAAAPSGTPMPAPMPPTPAYPPPAGGAPVSRAPAPPGAPEPQPGPSSAGPVQGEPASRQPGPGAPGIDQPSSGTGDPDGVETPEVPPPTPGAPDGVAGVAPHATVISIRQSSRAFEPESPGPGDGDTRRKAGTISTLARAIVHAADLGAKVINVSVTACVSAADPLDQRAIGAAVWYAATVRDAVVVAAAGNEGEDGCVQNPAFDPLDTHDPRDWRHVKTVSSPSWFDDYVLSVGAVDTTGAPLNKSLAGPWVAVAAPGVAIMGLSAQTGGPANAYPAVRPGERNIPFWGTSFSAAYVSGIAALVRAKYPQLSAHQVINRILQTAHNPPRGVDNQVGFGVVDPVAALTFDVPLGDRVDPDAETRVLAPPPVPAPPDHRARIMAVAFAGVVATAVLATGLVGRARRAR